VQGDLPITDQSYDIFFARFQCLTNARYSNLGSFLQDFPIRFLGKAQGYNAKVDQIGSMYPFYGFGDHTFHPQVHGAKSGMFPGRALAVAETGHDQVMFTLIAQGGCPAAEVFVQRLKDEFGVLGDIGPVFEP